MRVYTEVEIVSADSFVERFLLCGVVDMPCYKPVTAFQPLEGGSLVFSEKKGCREIKISCGQCIGCRLRKQNAWALRCLAESQMHSDNWFLTFTYRDDAVPRYGNLEYSDMQNGIRRIKDAFGSFRYFVCGEYGDTFKRCHFHMLAFGLKLPDVDVIRVSGGGQPVYKSKRLESVWNKGFVHVGLVTPQSARYCASYTLKKVTGDRAIRHYESLDPETGEVVWLNPEFARMSLKPGIGATWLDKYWRDLVTHNAMVSDGKKLGIPRYFTKRMLAFENEAIASEIESELSSKRAIGVEAHAGDLTAERLAVREQCAIARVKFGRERFGEQVQSC